MAGLTGLQGLTWAAQAWQVTSPEATAEERQGGTADPAHAQPLWANPYRYPWESRVFQGPQYPEPPDQGLPGSTAGLIAAAGSLATDPAADLTPYATHAAPWPKGVETSVDPDAVARQLGQSAAIHASNTGAGRRPLTAAAGWARQDDWVLIDTLREGDTLQDKDISAQLRSAAPGAGYGSRDRVASLARQNEHGFDQAHMRRRYADNHRRSIPGNSLWMAPGQRPMVKSIPGPARPPVGVDSFFTGQNTAAYYGPDQAILVTPAASYTAPPEPALGPAPGASSAPPGDVSWW